MELSQWKSKGTLFNYKNHSIFNYVAGSGPTILMLHGNPGAGFEFSRCVEYLQKDFKVIAVDLLGYGYSNKPTNYAYNIPDQAEMLEVLLSLHGTEGYSLLTSGYGTFVGMALIKAFYDRRKSNAKSMVVESFIALNSTLKGGTSKESSFDRYHRGTLGKYVTYLQTKKKYAKNYTALFSDPSSVESNFIDKMWELNEYNEGWNVHHLLKKYRVEYKRYIRAYSKSVKTLELPTLLLFGDKDPRLKKDALSKYKNAWPHAAVKLLKDVGHLPHIEQPKEVSRIVSQFYHQEVGLKTI